MAPGRKSSEKRASEKKSWWQADLSSLGKKGPDDSEPEHAAFVATLPQVNLLPQSVRDGIRATKIVRMFVLLLVLVLVASGALWYLQSDRIAQSERAVADATAKNEALRADLAALAPIRNLYEEITRLNDIVTETLAAQPQAETVIAQLIAAGEQVAGKDITFTSTDVIYNEIPEPGSDLNICPNPDPFNEEITIGCVTFSASVSSRDQVSDLLRVLEANPLFVGPYVTTSNVTVIEGEGDVVSFTGSAGVSTEGLVTALTAEQIDAIVNPPAQTDEAAADQASDQASDQSSDQAMAGSQEAS
ncbi:MAG: hypothetical protein WAO50_01700 [Candidatus Nanopelagicales bacterium]